MDGAGTAPLAAGERAACDLEAARLEWEAAIKRDALLKAATQVATKKLGVPVN